MLEKNPIGLLALIAAGTTIFFFGIEMTKAEPFAIGHSTYMIHHMPKDGSAVVRVPPVNKKITECPQCTPPCPPQGCDTSGPGTGPAHIA
jgi:hypothetical protein